MKTSIKLTFLFLILLFFHNFACCESLDIFDEDFCLYYIPEDTIYSLRQFIPSNEPPNIGKVEVKPIHPTSDTALIIKAKVVPEMYYTENNINEVFINYSINDSKIYTIEEMEQAVEEYTWKVKLPPQPSGTKINFFITAIDDEGNVVSEVPSTSIDWDIDKIEDFSIQIKEGKDEQKRILSDLDILKTSFAYDGNYLYFHFNVAGKISPGNVNVPYLHVYSVGFYHPKLFKKGSVKTNYVLIYAPNGKFVRFPEIGLLNTDKRLAEIIDAGVEYMKKDNNLWIRFKKSGIKEFDGDHIKIIFGTASGVSLEPIVLKPIDTTKFTKLIFNSHTVVFE